MELSERVDNLYVIYEELPSQFITEELQRSQERLQEQLARQMAMAQVLGERACSANQHTL